MEPVNDYKKYSLGRLTEWLHDCMSAAEVSPQEIFDTIKGVVEEEYYYYKNGASRTNELLQLLNGQVVFNIVTEENKVECAIGDTSEYCKGAWNNFWEDEVKDDGMRPWGHSDIEYCIANKDKVVKWQLPIEEVENGDTGEQEYFITFPDDLLEAANLKAGDEVEWVDNKDGTYTLRHIAVSNTLGMDADETT